VSSQEWDLRWGKLTRTTDTNGAVMTLTYDHRGRFSGATSPLTGGMVVYATYACPGMTGVHAARCATTSNLVESTGTSVMTYTAVDGMGAKRFMAKTEETSTSILTLFGAHQVDVWGRAVSTSKPIALGVQGPVMVQRPFLVGGGIS
jgi:YD repeat-containing protein